VTGFWTEDRDKLTICGYPTPWASKRAGCAPAALGEGAHRRRAEHGTFGAAAEMVSWVNGVPEVVRKNKGG